MKEVLVSLAFPTQGEQNAGMGNHVYIPIWSKRLVCQPHLDELILPGQSMHDPKGGLRTDNTTKCWVVDPPLPGKVVWRFLRRRRRVDFGLEWEPSLAATVDSFPCSPSVGKSAAKEETLGWALSRGGDWGEVVAYARNACGRRREVMQEYTLFCAASSFSWPTGACYSTTRTRKIWVWDALRDLLVSLSDLMVGFIF